MKNCIKQKNCRLHKHRNHTKIKLCLIAYLLAIYVATIGVCFERQCLAEPQIVSPVVASTNQLTTVVGGSLAGESATVVPKATVTPPVQKGSSLDREGFSKKVKLEKREDKLKAFLDSKNSPLAPHAHLIVKLADEYDISYTQVVAIAGKETSFGKAGQGPSFYNAWGIMSWDEDGKRSQRKFNNWGEGIEYTTKLISNSYREDMNRGIQKRYCPSEECHNNWVEQVSKFQEEINAL